MFSTISRGHRNATIATSPIHQELTQITTMDKYVHGQQTFLTREEIEILTGLKRPSFQCKWLRQNGIVFMLGNDQKPKVLQQTVLDRFDRNIKKGNRYTKEPEVRV